jgi:LPXTG-motif cell wall-anchored protein
MPDFHIYPLKGRPGGGETATGSPLPGTIGFLLIALGAGLAILRRRVTA